jgi:hypothetical protein
MDTTDTQRLAVSTGLTLGQPAYCVPSLNYSLTQRQGTWEAAICAVGRRLTRKRENPVWACAWHIPIAAITHRKIMYMYCIRRIIFSKHNASISMAAISMLLLWIISLQIILTYLLLNNFFYFWGLQSVASITTIVSNKIICNHIHHIHTDSSEKFAKTNIYIYIYIYITHTHNW